MSDKKYMALFDEAHGLTTEMIYNWMRQSGWTLTAANDGGAPFPQKNGLKTVSWSWSPDQFLESVAQVEGISVQTLLRKMNPGFRLEEAQGLTDEMVIHHLNQTGWSNFPDMKRHILKPFDIMIDFADMDHAIKVLAQLSKLTPQALLRQLNPRMRRGWPSDAALAAHPGLWIVGIKERAKLETFDAHVLAEWKTRARFTVSCWPCDGAGNKVLWPERDGVML